MRSRCIRGRREDVALQILNQTSLWVKTLDDLREMSEIDALWQTLRYVVMGERMADEPAGLQLD